MRHLKFNSFIIVLLAITCSCFPKRGMEELTYFEGEKHKGVCWVGSSRPLEGGELKLLKATGANFISQTPFGWQEKIDAPHIRFEKHSEKMWWGEKKFGLETTTDSARVLGIESMLKPHIWVRGSWPGEIAMKNETDWQLWFENYTAFILYYAELAETNNLPLLCIGTELEKTSGREKEWRKVIEKVKEVYSGKLIYAANFTEYQNVPFWDAVDYIGIQAYFPLKKGTDPSVSQLIAGWNKFIPEIEKINRKYKKPIIFTELGYCNTIDAAESPWIWPNERSEVPLSEEVQAKCYQAFFEAVWEKPWLQGVYFWKWYPKPRDRNPDFTPQNKMAENVMKSYFNPLVLKH